MEGQWVVIEQAGRLPTVLIEAERIALGRSPSGRLCGVQIEGLEREISLCSLDYTAVTAVHKSQDVEDGPHQTPGCYWCGLDRGNIQ